MTASRTNLTVLPDLTERLAQFEVPGASIAIQRIGRLDLDVAGVLDTSEGTAVRPDSIFEIGSITKVWTATLVLQLASAGLLNLDAPVQDVLPEFRIADQDAARRITARHLLTHSGGFEGDVFADTGEGDDCLEIFIGELADAPQYFPPGQLFSYSNAGFCVLGRMVEQLTGEPFDHALAERIVAPLALRDVHPQRDTADGRRVARGHRPDSDGKWTPTSERLPRSWAPAGTRLAMTATDLARFGAAHLAQTSPVGIREILPGEALHRMQEPQAIDVPDLADQWPPHRGLGWEIDDIDGLVVLGHDGDTVGQHAFLRVVPALGLSVAALTNGGHAHAWFSSYFKDLLAQELGAAFPGSLVTDPKDRGPGASLLVGQYSGTSARWTVSELSDGRLSLLREPLGYVATLQAPRTEELAHVRGRTFLTVGDDPLAYAFGGTGDQPAPYLHSGRAYPRLHN